jgi:hypothetical protein
MSSLSSKLIAIIAIGVTALAVYIYVAPDHTGESVPQPILADKSVQVKKAAVVKNVNVTIPAVEKKQEAVRNPFAVPPEYLNNQAKSTDGKEPPEQQLSPGSGQMSSFDDGHGAAKAATEIPKISVTGIVSSDDGQQLAVINDGKQSRAYRLGEWIGLYRVKGIASDTVSLTGPAGEIILPITDNIKSEKGIAKERTGSGNDPIHNVAQ